MPLIVAPIVIGSNAWVAADVFVGPGVTVGEGAVVGARSTVIHDVAPWTVVAGSPAALRGRRPQFARPS
jgi:putative colanic acid biosynthesis acetyltransferase WcaF